MAIKKNQQKEYLCPICGYGGLDESPYDEKGGSSSFDICPCCGVEFGLEDQYLEDRSMIGNKDYNEGLITNWERIRNSWKKIYFWKNPRERPKNWKPDEQLKNVEKFLANYRKTGKFDFTAT